MRIILLIAAATSFVIAAFFLVSGTLKATDLVTFESVLRTWKTLPPWILPAIVVFVPMAELSIGSWMLAAKRDYRPKLMACFIILIFTVATLVEHRLSGQVSCGCFGLRDASATSNISVVLARNGLIIILLMSDIVLHRKTRWTCDKE